MYIAQATKNKKVARFVASVRAGLKGEGVKVSAAYRAAENVDRFEIRLDRESMVVVDVCRNTHTLTVGGVDLNKRQQTVTMHKPRIVKTARKLKNVLSVEYGIDLKLTH